MSTTAPSKPKKTLFSNTEEVKIPAGDLHRYPANREPSKDSVAAMRDSILENGQLQPITARPIELEDGTTRFEIIFGETRVRGCQAISPTHPVRCYLIPMSDQEAARIHAVENFQRKELDPIEEAQAMENMRENGWEVNAIALILGITRKTVAQRLRLLKLDETTRTAVREKTLSMNVADAIASLPEEDRPRAVEMCVNPTHSAEPLPEREALRQIEMKIIAPRKKADEWEKQRPTLEKKHPSATFLDYADAEKAQHWDSEFEPIQNSPGYKYQSEAVRQGDLENRTWGELAKKWGSETYIGLPAMGDDECTLLVKVEPLVAAELAACESDPMSCIFQHPAQRRENDLAREKEQSAEQARLAALENEFRQALLIISRPESIQPPAAERLCVEFFAEHSGNFDFAAGLLPGFEDTQEMEPEAFRKLAAAYLRTKSIRGFEALGRLYVLSQLDMPPTNWSVEALARILIGTKALKEKDFPLLAAAWKEICAEKLAADEKALATAAQEETP